MTNLEEEIIKCAEAGGWLHPKKKWEKRCEETKLRRCKEMNIPVEDYGNHYWVDNSDSFFVDNFSNYVLDPNFWEAIGRAKEWEERNTQKCNCGHYKKDHNTVGGSGLHRGGETDCLHCVCKMYRSEEIQWWYYYALRFHEINLDKTKGWQPAIEYLYSLISNGGK